MRWLLFLVAAVGFGQTGPRNLDFEEGISPGWFAPKAISGFTVKLTDDHPKSGKHCAEIDFTGGEKPSPFGNIMQTFDATPYRGKRVRLRAAVRTSDRAQMWFRVDRADHNMGFFDNMQDRPILVSEWQYFDITGDIDSDAERINIGLMLLGKGKAWIDDVSFDVLGDSPGISSYVAPPSAAFDKLTEAVKLWVYVKYFHTRVTMPGVDWDQAFMDAVPKILEAKGDDDLAAAVNGMLAVLHDPYTRVVPNDPDEKRVMTVLSEADGVLVVGLTRGKAEEVMKRVGSAKAVVFDFRDGRAAGPFGENSGMASMRRVHRGYANQNPNGYRGYSSSWEIEDRSPVKEVFGALRPILLVNSRSVLPDSALAMQEAGLCAIVSEDAISDAQAQMGSDRRVGNLHALVRTREFDRADGTSGLTANVVLNKSGDAALKDAVELARWGKWPRPMERSQFQRPPAVYTEKVHQNPFPGAEMRMMAAAQIWGVFNYFHPYKYLYGEDWDAVLAEFLPRMAAAKSAREYHLAVAEMVAHTHDSHCYVFSSDLMNALGRVASAVEVRWIENQPVVTRVLNEELAKSVHPGDVVTKIDGAPVQKRIDEVSRYIAASTPQSLQQRVMAMLLSARPGAEPTVTLRGANGEERDVSTRNTQADFRTLYTRRSGEIYRLVSPKIGYVDLDRLENEQVDAMFEAFKDTDAIIMDMRGYPHGTAWTIAPRLATAPGMVNAQFRTNVVCARGGEGGDVRSEIFEQRIPLTEKPRYKGKTVLLIDDRAMSQSEHSGIMYKIANGTVFIGSPTDGANGDVTGFTAPGGIRIPFSGHDVRWPDGKQLQRVGLIPDIEAHPTIAGIRAGRDEILERAVRYVESGR